MQGGAHACSTLWPGVNLHSTSLARNQKLLLQPLSLSPLGWFCCVVQGMFDQGFMQQMMQNPMVQQLLSNPEMMRNMLQMNPGVREVLQQPGVLACICACMHACMQGTCRAHPCSSGRTVKH